MIELKTETGSIAAYLSDSALRMPQDPRTTAAWRSVVDNRIMPSDLPRGNLRY